jgi:Tfp pilus assembly protein FimT
MKTLIALALLALLAGCASPEMRGALAARAADATDRVISDAEFALCRGVPVGAVIRRYGTSDDAWASWTTLCGYTGRTLPRPDTGAGDAVRAP